MNDIVHILECQRIGHHVRALGKGVSLYDASAAGKLEAEGCGTVRRLDDIEVEILRIDGLARIDADSHLTGTRTEDIEVGAVVIPVFLYLGRIRLRSLRGEGHLDLVIGNGDNPFLSPGCEVEQGVLVYRRFSLNRSSCTFFGRRSLKRISNALRGHPGRPLYRCNGIKLSLIGYLLVVLPRLVPGKTEKNQSDQHESCDSILVHLIPLSPLMYESGSQAL